MKLRFLSWWLDVTLALYLRAHAAYSAALPRRAGDGEQVRRAMGIDYRDQMQ